MPKICYSLAILYDAELLRPVLEPKTEERTKWAIQRDKKKEEKERIETRVVMGRDLKSGI